MYFFCKVGAGPFERGGGKGGLPAIIQSHIFRANGSYERVYIGSGNKFLKTICALKIL